MAGLHGYTILNKPGVYTRTPDTPLQRPSVIDYTLANRPLGNHIKHWKTNITHTGSDHRAIVTTITTKSFMTARPAPAWEKITWMIDGKPSEVMKEELRKLMDFEARPEDPHSFRETKRGEPQLALENFEYNLSLLIHTIKKHPPTKRLCRWSKPWWTEELTQPRKTFCREGRLAREDPGRKELSNQAKRNYQNKLKQAKSAHWRSFLEKGNKNNVWTAHQFTQKRMGIFVPGGTKYLSASHLNDTIMQHFFPPNSNPVDTSLPEYVELEDTELVDTMEVTMALRKCSNTSAPGPDQVLYGVWKGIHRTEPEVIPTLLNDLFRWSIHPPRPRGCSGHTPSKTG